MEAVYFKDLAQTKCLHKSSQKLKKGFEIKNVWERKTISNCHLKTHFAH
jgi:hypothetical protein